MNFQKVIKNLNPTQSKAIDNLEGCVMVEAGPGTGKTMMLSARVGKMLKSEQTIAPNMILCLTFTDSGAVTMRKRLVELIGPEAYKVNIYTFHSFCNDVVMKNLDYFGIRKLEPVSELETYEILYEIIDELPSNHPLSRIKGDSYYESGRMKNLFRNMKEESWTVELIIEKTRQYIDQLPMRKEFIYLRDNKKKNIKAGDPKTHLIEKEKEKLRKLVSAARLLTKYNEKLFEKGRYDFSDMIHWVINAFKDDKYFLMTFQEKYQYILVDEFQDTNGSQMELLYLLLSFWPDPNAFVVFDFKQTIFEFQGARINNIKEFRNNYNPKIFDLLDNYRSTQNILDAAKLVIENNTIRFGLGPEKYLVSKSNLVIQNTPIKVIECSSYDDEERYVISKIMELINNDVPCNEIAVIYRKHRQAENIIKEFQLRSIPINVKRRVNVLSETIILQIIEMIKYITIEAERPIKGLHDSLFRIMHYEYFGVESKEIGVYFQSLGKKMPGEQVEKVLNIFIDLIAEYHNTSLIELLESIINKTRLLDYVMGHKNKLQLLLNINTFFTFVKSEVFKNPLLTGMDLIKRIDKMWKNDIKLPVLDINYDEEGVTFTTCHGAKGTEFHCVFLMGCNRDQWEKSRGSYNTYKIPDTLSSSMEEDKLESNRRLFYVAVTRAKQHLIITYAGKNNEGAELERSQFIDESQLQVFFNKEKIGIVEHLEYQLQKTEFKPALEKDFINSILENYSLSVSGLSKYLKCPISFYYEDVLRVPFLANEALIYGNAIHIALKKLYDDNTCNKDCLVKEFEDELIRNRGQISREAFQRRKQLGIVCLEKYFNEIFPISCRSTRNEYTVKNVMIDDIPVKYIFDKIEIYAKEVYIVDYKTGKVVDIHTQVKSPTEKNLIGGDYWRQMVFGKLVIDQIHWEPWKCIGAEIFVVDDKEMGKIGIPIAVGDELIVKQQIKEVWEKIMKHEFSEGCGKCQWCEFQKRLKI